MTTRLYTHDSFTRHDTGAAHPERSARLHAVTRALETPEFDSLDRHVASAVSHDRLALVHSPAFIEALLSAIPRDGHRRIDLDTVISPASGDAALHASGAVVDAIDAVMEKRTDNAFCAVRPPGHHAEPANAMGFCLFNSIAVGAAHARNRWGLSRVAVIDFDVHHGNGTQAMFWDHDGMFYASSHQFPCFPGTGSVDECGRYNNIVNAPLARGSGSHAFRRAFAERILPALDAFRPELVLISAGFDAHEEDPLADINLVTEDYSWVTDEISALADSHADGRIVSVLEGGYALEALASSVMVHVRRLMAVNKEDGIQ